MLAASMKDIFSILGMCLHLLSNSPPRDQVAGLSPTI
jgi:hypothetical protein